MRNFIFALAVVSLFLTGCGKAREPQEGSEALNTETLNVSEADALLGAPAAAPVQQANVANIVVNSESGPLLEQPAPSSVSTETPDSMMIQQALKNAGFYQGAVDGKIGPRSKEAIKDFQRKNDLVADGKVGPKTWALLKGYLDQSAASSPAQEN